jgi:hypothetical protein
MSTFQKTVFTFVLATAFAAVPAISHGEKEVCSTDTAGNKHCVVLVCLKPDENKTTPMVEVDPEICVTVVQTQRYQGASSRKELVKRITDGCINAGGILEDKGSRVTCTLRGSKLQKPSKQQGTK